MNEAPLNKQNASWLKDTRRCNWKKIWDMPNTWRKIQRFRNLSSVECRINAFFQIYLSKSMPWLTTVSDICVRIKHIICQGQVHSRFSAKPNDSSQDGFWPSIDSTTSNRQLTRHFKGLFLPEELKTLDTHVSHLTSFWKPQSPC